MNYSANSVNEIKAHKDLPCNLLNQMKREPFVVVPFEDFEEIYTQYLKNHAEMIPIRSFVQERVQQVKHMTVISIESGFFQFIMS